MGKTMPGIPTPDTLDRLLQRRERVARAAAAAIAHHHGDAQLLETCQMDLEETLEDLLPVRTWRVLMPTWRELDLLLSHDPNRGQRDPDCQLCQPATTAPGAAPLQEPRHQLARSA
jgi:hypothetical protein